MVGAGWVTQYHLPAWQKQSHRARVVAIADPSAEARAVRQQAYDIPAGYDTAAELLERESLDILDICTPQAAHAEVVRLAAGKKIAVMCQKPLTPTFGEAADLVAGLDPSVRLMVHENWRFRPNYRLLKQWLDEGVAGAIRAIRLDFLSGGMIPDATGARPALIRQPFFRTLPRLLVSEVLSHHLDTLRYLFGELELLDATLQRTNDEILGEDVAAVNLRRVDDGAPVTVYGSLATHGEPPIPYDRVRVYGSNGTIDLESYKLTAKGPLAREASFEPAAGYQQGFDDAIRHFLDCLATGASFETSPVDNLKTLALVESIYGTAHWRDRG
jgi:predicted dehydrogenase